MKYENKDSQHKTFVKLKVRFIYLLICLINKKLLLIFIL